MDKAKIIAELRDIENQLSPENLCCDGEADPRWVRKRARQLYSRKAKLVAKLGYEPDIYELYPEFKVR